jgi:hypothetical protein
LLQFLCNAIKKYVAMNNGTIVYSVALPVIGRLLDSVVPCPILFLNYASIGGLGSGVVLTKEYFDSSFEQVNERFDGINAQLGNIDIKIDNNHLKIVSEISDVKKEVSLLNGWFQSLDQKSGIMMTYMQDFSSRLKNMASFAVRLETMSKKNSQQLESIESQLLLLKQELGLVKEEAKKLVVENRVLREDLRVRDINSNKRFDTLEEKIDRGFDRMENKLDNPTVVSILNNSTTVPFIASPDRSMLSRNNFARVDSDKDKLLLMLNNS